MIPLILALTCIPVDGPKVLARHIAAAVTQFSEVAPETDLGYAPVPGVVRVVHADEVARLASRHGISLASAPRDVCFEWPLKPLHKEAVIEAMTKVLPENTSLEVVELSRAAVPAGDLEFPLERLQGNIWRGSVRYSGSGSGRFDVWARVILLAKQKRVITVEALQTGETISLDHVRVEEFEGPPVADLVSCVEEAVGMVVKRALPARAVLRTQYLERPAVISKGDTVRLRTSVGIAHVIVEASAQAPGRIGDIIPVKNASSGRLLRGRVEAPGEVRLAQ